ncbi:hypothetical protein L0F63_006215 [Massospora cicadina]|nr:hypothetical protein L0F63_006215 [Massospora cicadina]
MVAPIWVAPEAGFGYKLWKWVAKGKLMLKIRPLYISVLLAVACQAYTTEVNLDAARILTMEAKPDHAEAIVDRTTPANYPSQDTTLRDSFNLPHVTAPLRNTTPLNNPTPSAKSDGEASSNFIEAETRCEVGEKCTGMVRKYTLQPPDDLYEANPNPPTVTELELPDPKNYLPTGLNVEEGTKYILRTFTKLVNTTNCTLTFNTNQPNHETPQPQNATDDTSTVPKVDSEVTTVSNTSAAPVVDSKVTTTSDTSAAPKVDPRLTCDPQPQSYQSKFPQSDSLKLVGIFNATCSPQKVVVNDNVAVGPESISPKAQASQGDGPILTKDEGFNGEPNKAPLSDGDQLEALPKGAIIVDQSEDCPEGTEEYILKGPYPVTPAQYPYQVKISESQPTQAKLAKEPIHSEEEEDKTRITRGDMAPQFFPVSGADITGSVTQPSNPDRDEVVNNGIGVDTTKTILVTPPAEQLHEPEPVPKFGIKVVDQDEPCPKGYVVDPDYIQAHAIQGKPNQLTENGLGQVCEPRVEFGVPGKDYPPDTEYSVLDCGKYLKKPTEDGQGLKCQKPTEDGQGLKCQVEVKLGIPGEVYPFDTDCFTLDCGTYWKKRTTKGQVCFTEEIKGSPDVYYPLDTNYAKLECGDYLKAEVEFNGEKRLRCTKHRKALELKEKHKNLPHLEYYCPDDHHLLATDTESYCAMEQVGEPEVKYPLNDFVKFTCTSGYELIKEDYAQYCSATTLNPELDEEVTPLPHQTVVCPSESTLVENGSAKVCKADVVRASSGTKYTLLGHQSLECPADHTKVDHGTSVSCELNFIQAGPDNKVELYPHQTLKCDDGYIPDEDGGYATCITRIVRLQPNDPYFPKPGQEIECEEGYHAADDGGAKVCIENGKIFDGSDFKLYEIELIDTLTCPSKFPSQDVYNDTGNFVGKQCGGQPMEINGNVNETYYLRPIDILNCGKDQYVDDSKDGNGVKVKSCLAQTVVAGEVGKLYPKDPSVKVECEPPAVLQVKGVHQICTDPGSQYLVVDTSDCPDDTEFIAEYPPQRTDKLLVHGLPEAPQPVDEATQEFLCPYGYVAIEGEELDNYLKAQPSN